MSNALVIPVRGADRAASPVLGFFLERDRDVTVRAKADLAVLDIGDQAERDVVVMPFVARRAFVDLRARILLGQLDAAALDSVDRADMDAVCADDFGMFLNLRCVDHACTIIL